MYAQFATMYESEVSDHCYSGPSYSLPQSHASSWRPSISGLIATVWKPSVSLAVLNAPTFQHIGSLTLRPTRWLVRVLMSKLLKLLAMLSSGSIMTFVRQAYCILVQQFNLIVRHQEDAAIDYTGLHWLFIKKPWLDVMNVQSYHPILNLSVGVQAS